MYGSVSKDICEIIGSGSTGNAVLYHRNILVDIGLPYKKIEPYKNEIQIVLLTHEHLSDHLNIQALKKLCFERPSLRVACGEFLAEKLQGIRNVDILEAGKIYDYGAFKISPIVLYHDVPNFGYRIFKGDHKTIHITDTFTLEGISAKDYDLYCIESNYNEDTIFESIDRKKSKGEFAYQECAINSHLSEQQARDFIFKNRGEHSKVLRLHESKNY
jgi:hypothetical protein